VAFLAVFDAYEREILGLGSGGGESERAGGNEQD
jgi:hypothetical protein